MSEGGVKRPGRAPGQILIGTSGYSFPDWVGPFYPPGIDRSRMLEYYAREFPVVEVNATYYRIPPAATLRAMAAKTPAEFQFVVKAHHDMTHERSLEPDLYAAFAKALGPVIDAGKLHGLIAQFPYSFRRTPENETFLVELKRRLPDAPLFVEFRHRSWVEPSGAGGAKDVGVEAGASLWRLLNAEGIGYVSVDEPDLPGLMPPIAQVTGSAGAEIGYVRFHGRNKENWWGPKRTGAAPVTASDSSYGPLFAGIGAGAGAGGADLAADARAPLGPSGASGDRYDYLYSEAELQEWVAKIRDMTVKAKKTFVFFNNCHVGQAATGAKLMRRLLEGEGLL